jgi:phage baseplate assembly protein W
MPVYSGFSTVSSSSQKKFVLTDRALIKQDLLNAFMTKRGSRLMRPKDGCIIWDKLFDNLTATDLSDISDNLSSIVNADPRVKLVSLDISTSIPNTMVATIQLQYVGTNEVDTMVATFNSDLTSNF